MALMQPIYEGDRARSEFSVIQGFEFGPADFDEPHIGVAAMATPDGIFSNPIYERFWAALGAPEGAVWKPNQQMQGGRVVGKLVHLLVGQYVQHGLMEEATAHTIWGDVVNYDGVTRDLDPDTTYNDLLAHVDFVAPELGCAVLFASNTGGTIGWQGDFKYQGTVKPSYAEQTEGMSTDISRPDTFLFSPDARTFLHARDKDVINEGRVLARIFIGPQQ